MAQQRISDILEQVDLFSGLDKKDFLLLAEHFRRVEFMQGEVIIKQGMRV